MNRNAVSICLIYELRIFCARINLIDIYFSTAYFLFEKCRYLNKRA